MSSQYKCFSTCPAVVLFLRIYRHWNTLMNWRTKKCSSCQKTTKGLLTPNYEQTKIVSSFRTQLCFVFTLWTQKFETAVPYVIMVYVHLCALDQTNPCKSFKLQTEVQKNSFNLMADNSETTVAWRLIHRTQADISMEKRSLNVSNVGQTMQKSSGRTPHLNLNCPYSSI